MYSHPLGDSAQIGARLMMSLDPLTEGGRGYPLLFQTGESWHDQPLHDRQHPHDLFDELRSASRKSSMHDFSAYVYFGYPGEPALGPPTFMHRPSAMDDPDAPIGHHWQDSTHITFGVATAGLVWSRFDGMKIEGSIFTGREPDEDRYDFDRPRFDSYSGRISWNPTQNLALQVSHGYIKSPEALEPETKHPSHDRIGHLQSAARSRQQLVKHVRLGPEQRHWRGQNTIVPDRIKLSARPRHSLSALGARGKIRPRTGSQSSRMNPNFSRLADTRIGYIRDLSHGKGMDIGLGTQFTINDRPDRSRSLLRRRSRLRVPIFPAHPPLAAWYATRRPENRIKADARAIGEHVRQGGIEKSTQARSQKSCPSAPLRIALLVIARDLREN